MSRLKLEKVGGILFVNSFKVFSGIIAAVAICRMETLRHGAGNVLALCFMYATASFPDCHGQKGDS